MSRFLAVGVTLAALAAACESSRPISPSERLVGVWSGTVHDEASGSGSLRFTLTAGSGGGVTGTWAAAFSDEANDDGGTLSATVPLGAPLVFGLDCARMGAALVSMTVDGTRMAGTYSGVSCPGLQKGTATLSKQ